MNRIAAFTLAAASILALAGCSAPAERDEARFLERFENIGDYTAQMIQDEPDRIIAFGDSVCEFYADGLKPREIWEGLTDQVEGPWDEGDNLELVIMARNAAEFAAQDLCPEEYGHLSWDD